MYIPGNLKMKNWIRIYVILQPYCVLYEYVQCTYTCTYVHCTAWSITANILWKALHRKRMCCLFLILFFGNFQFRQILNPKFCILFCRMPFPVRWSGQIFETPGFRVNSKFERSNNRDSVCLQAVRNQETKDTTIGCWWCVISIKLMVWRK